MKKSKPEVSRILGLTLKEMVASIFDLDRFAEKSWLRMETILAGLDDAMVEKPQKPKYTYPLRRDSKGRMMKPETVNWR